MRESNNKGPETSTVMSKILDGVVGAKESCADDDASQMNPATESSTPPESITRTTDDQHEGRRGETDGGNRRNAQDASGVGCPTRSAETQERTTEGDEDPSPSPQRNMRVGAFRIDREPSGNAETDTLQYAPEEDYAMPSLVFEHPSTQLLEGELIPEAKVVEPPNEGDNDDRRRQQRRILLVSSIAGVVLLITLVALGVAMRRRNGGDDSEMAPSQDKQPWNTPSLTPTFASPYQPSTAPISIASRIISYSPWTTFDDPGSGQSLALEWIATDDLSLVLLSESDYSLFLQRFALAVLHFATNGEVWGDLSEAGNFISPSGECTNRSGQKNPPYLQCDVDGFVTDINLENLHKLSPLDYVTGTLPPELALLSRLTSFWAPDNQWAGQLPTPLCRLTALQTLDLQVPQWARFVSRISGPLPTEIGNMTTLELLNLRGHDFDLPVPSELWRLTKLAHLAVGTRANDDHQGGFAYPSEVGLLTALTVLSLNEGLSGTIPTELGQLSQAHTIDFSWNITGGTLPSELGSLTELLSVLMQQPRPGLIGSVPSELGLLTQMTTIDLLLTGLSGELPSEIGLMRSLEICKLPLSGAIPTEIGLLSRLYSVSLIQITQQSSSPLPSEFGLLTNLEALDIQGVLSGTIPTEIGLLASLYWFRLTQNRLVGPIPTELFALSSLNTFSLYDNDFQTSIPSEIGLVPRSNNLLVLNLEESNLTGTIPTELSNVREGIAKLQLANNPHLNGQLPDMTNLIGLRYLSLQGTGLDDTIDCGKFPGACCLELDVDFWNVGNDIHNCRNETSNESSYCSLICEYGDSFGK